MAGAGQIRCTASANAPPSPGQRPFSDEELAQLTFLTGTTNLWDRLAVGFRLVHPERTRPTDISQARSSFEPASAKALFIANHFRQEKELQEET